MAHLSVKTFRFNIPAILLVVALAVSGCVTAGRQPYTASQASAAAVSGFSDVRTYLDTDMLPTEVGHWAPGTPGKEKNFLVISGGGAGGAFGVGILAAWTKTGTRPTFDMVTGVSTGALIAPFAFLGPQYDDTLVRLYTSGVAKRLMQMRPLPEGLLGQSLAKAEPLLLMVQQNVTQTLLQAVAAEHRKGRRLLVLTTNLDSQRAVVWNMGAIADSGKPDALKLFREILVASASIPGIYPAVMIQAQVDGKPLEEMHSDGGTASQFLAVPDSLMIGTGPTRRPSGFKPNMYVIINNALMPEFEMTSDKTLSVMARAYATLVKSQTRSALQALYGFSQKEGIRFHVASIDAIVRYDPRDPFGTAYMRAVYNLGAAEMEGGSVWKGRPIFPVPSSLNVQDMAPK